MGACAGADLIVEAMLAALFVLASNTLPRPVVNRINRRPVVKASGEATYLVYVICDRVHQAEVHESLLSLLEAASYPVRSVGQHAFGDDAVEIEATLYATAVEALELDRVILQLEARPEVRQAFWNASAEERRDAAVVAALFGCNPIRSRSAIGDERIDAISHPMFTADGQSQRTRRPHFAASPVHPFT